MLSALIASLTFATGLFGSGLYGSGHYKSTFYNRSPAVTIVDVAGASTFNVFTVDVVDTTNLNTLTLSAAAAPYDWSGVSWKSLRFSDMTVYATCVSSCTLISNKFAIGAWHCSPATSDVVYFRDRNGVERSATVADKARLTGSDLALIRFTSSVHADVTRYPVLGRHTWMHERYAYQLEWDGEVLVPELSTNLLGFTRSTLSTSSGKPTLVPLSNGKFALMGAHFASDSDPATTTAFNAWAATQMAAYSETLTVFDVPVDAAHPVRAGALPLYDSGIKTKGRK